MSDISIVFTDRDLLGDFAWTPTDLATGNDLKTSVLISLFTERGWWADAYEPDQIGSRLLTLRRATRSNDTRLRAESYCREALRWMIEDQVASRVDVDAQWYGSLLGIRIRITQATGATQYSFEWAAV